MPSSKAWARYELLHPGTADVADVDGSIRVDRDTMSHLKAPKSRARSAIGTQDDKGGTVGWRVGLVASIGDERCPGVINCHGIRPSDCRPLPLL